MDFNLSVATYSFWEFQRDYTIKAIKQLGVSYVDIKDFHLPMNDTPKQLVAGRKRFDDACLKVVGGGNINLASMDDADCAARSTAKACGFPMMICAPIIESLPKVEKPPSNTT